MIEKPNKGNPPDRYAPGDFFVILEIRDIILKPITDKEDFMIPILVLFNCSFLLGRESSSFVENMQDIGSVILAEKATPIIFVGGALSTIINILVLFIPVLLLFILAVRHNSLLLRITYIICTIPLMLSKPVIMKLGNGNLFIVKIVILFIVAILLMMYLFNVSELYKTKLRQRDR